MSVGGARRGEPAGATPGGVWWLVPLVVLVASLVVGVTLLQRPWRGPVDPALLDLRIDLRLTSSPSVTTAYVEGHLWWTPPRTVRRGLLHLVLIHRPSGTPLVPVGSLPRMGPATTGWSWQLSRLAAEVDWLAPLRDSNGVHPQALSAPIGAIAPLHFLAELPTGLDAVRVEDIIVGVVYADAERAWWGERVAG